MKKNLRHLSAEFGPEARFDVRPNPPAPFRVLQENELERLKNQLLSEQLAHATQVELYAPLRRAANEAAALAWVTLFPLLLFPVLFEEKTRAAERQLERQARILANGRNQLAA